jgi:hypothetical protein
LKDAQQAFTIIIGPAMMFLCLINLLVINKKWLQNIIVTFLVLISFYNIKRNCNINNGGFQLSNFDKKILVYSEKKIKSNNWYYYSEQPSSNWFYNVNICSCPIVKNKDSKLGIEIAPFFNDNYDYYKQKNKSSPICKINHNINSFLKMSKKRNINYVFVENINCTKNEFLKYLVPILKENNKGLFRIKH